MSINRKNNTTEDKATYVRAWEFHINNCMDIGNSTSDLGKRVELLALCQKMSDLMHDIADEAYGES